MDLETCGEAQSVGPFYFMIQVLLMNLKKDDCSVSPASEWPRDVAPAVVASSLAGGKLQYNRNNEQ